MPFEIDISSRQSCLSLNQKQLRAAVVRCLELERVASAVLSISIVDNAAIHTLNRDHLQHDYPTDVISFPLEFTPAAEQEGWDAADNDVEDNSADIDDDARDPRHAIPAESVDGKTEGRAAGAAIEGEIVASAEMAASMASEGKWSAESELTLYVIHGMLHICGYDDRTPEDKRIMRNRERTILSSLGMNAVYTEDGDGLAGSGF